jgi:hypothetical protein
MNVGNRVPYRELFKKLNMLPLHSRYILSLLLFVVKNIDEFKSNFEVHSINTRHRSDLFPPTIKLSKYHKGVYYSGIKIFSHLLQSIKHLSWNVKKFKLVLKSFFYWVDFTPRWISCLELYEWSWYSDIILHHWYYYIILNINIYIYIFYFNTFLY